MKRKILVIGIGNALRGDDAIGLRVAEALGPKCESYADVLQCEGPLVDTLGRWFNAAKVICIDACRDGASTGNVTRKLWQASEWDQMGLYSSHAFGVTQTIELAQSLKLLPDELVIYAVSAQHFQLGAKLSREMQNALPSLIDAVLREVLA